MKPKRFFSAAAKLTPEEKAKRRGDAIKTELTLAIVSFSLPFVMALLYSLIASVTIEEVFRSAYRFAVLGGMLFIASNAIAAFYFFGHRVSVHQVKQITVIAVSIFLAFSLSTIFAAYISIYIVPVCFIGLMIALLIDSKLALYVNTISVVGFFFCYASVQGGFDMANLLGAIVTQSISGCFLILLSKKVYTRMSFFVDSVAVGVFIAFPVAFLSGLILPDFNVITAVKSGVWSMVSTLFGLALFMIILPVFEYAFSMYSNFRLDEICTPDAPLMARLAKEAPGTYNHSLAMANLAQACAMAIGENATLARAAACYHDVGKLRNPVCFTENQTDYNPHDDFIPEVSVSLITRHTHDGAELIRESGLPECLAKIAEEHHGKTTVGFFLNKTRGYTDEQLASSDFSYDGPKPSTKISGLIMIVDTVEAATRAQGVDKDMRNFTAFIHKLIMDKMDSGQFSECPLTLKDLQVIEDTLVKTLPSLYHQRIKYTK